MSEPLGLSQGRQIDQQSGTPRLDEKVLELIDVNKFSSPIDKQSVTGTKMSAHDTLATLSGNRIEISKIEFTGGTSEGWGGHADVILATLVLDIFDSRQSGRQKVAIKKFRLSSEMDEEKFLRAFVNEIRVLDGLSHENVVKIIGFVEEIGKGIAWIVFSWEENGNVREFLQSGEWDIPERVSLIQDVASGVEYIHTCQPLICHGDLKSLNILINSSHRAIITDFGSARLKKAREPRSSPSPERPTSTNDGAERNKEGPQVNLSASNSQLTLTGPNWSFRWAAPEILDGEEPDLASDVWALGWIAWEVVTDNYPFPEFNALAPITLMIVEGQLPPIYDDNRLSQIRRLCSVMTKCWRVEPKERPSAAQCRELLSWIPSIIPAMKGSGTDRIRSAALLLEIGDLRRLQDENDQAFLSFEEALTIARSTGDKLAAANALLRLGTIHRVRSQYTKAEECCTQALDIYTIIKDEGGRADAFLQLGDIHRAQSNLAEAEAFYEEALAIFTSSQRDGGRANTLIELGDIKKAQSKYPEAESYHTQSLALYTALGNDLGRANALVALGDDHLAQANYADAEATYAQALAAYTSIGYDLGRGDSLLALADIHRRQRDYAEAEELYTQALDLCTSIGYNLGRANTLLGLGNNRRARSDHVGAKDSFGKALDMFTKMGSSKGRVSALIGLAQVHLDQAEYAEGKAFIDQASEISNEIGYEWGKRHLKQMLAKYLRAAPSSAVPLPTSLPWGEVE